MDRGTTPYVTIIVPVYNAGEWLPRCLDSIAAQTYENWECILVDDGSSDGSSAVCDAYASHDSRFKVIHQENGGVCKARNKGLEIVRGEYVVFCDQDDMMAEHTLEYALEIQNQNPDVFVIWNMTRSLEGFQQDKAHPLHYAVHPLQQITILHMGSMLFVHVWNKLFSVRRLKEKQVRFDERLGRVSTYGGEDGDFVQKYMEGCTSQQPIAYAQAAWYYHALDNNQGSITGIALQRAGDIGELGDPEPGYCDKILMEFVQDVDSIDVLLKDYAQEAYPFMLHYYRCLCYGIWSARKLHEKLPAGFWRDPRLLRMLDWCRRNHIHIPYYLPLRARQGWLAAKMYEWSQLRSPNYGHFDWLFYYLLGGNWKRPNGL